MKPRAYKAGQHRGQGMLLPPSIDEYVAEGNPVRAIDAYAESLDLGALGFQNTAGESNNNAGRRRLWRNRPQGRIA